MVDHGYLKRGLEVEVARAEIDTAIADLANRWDDDDPRTRRWKQAVERFHKALNVAYAGSLKGFAEGSKVGSEVETEDILNFLEADPKFFRSGYMKERVLTLLKQRELADLEVARFQAAVLKVVSTPDRRREFVHYCRAAVKVDQGAFRKNLEALEESEDMRVALRANWVLAALNGKFEAISSASRNIRWWRNQGLDIYEKAWIARDE